MVMMFRKPSTFNLKCVSFGTGELGPWAGQGWPHSKNVLIL